MGKTLYMSRAAKVAVTSDGWKTGKMPKSAFSLSKNNSFRLGAGWDWCIHHVAHSSNNLRLLIAFHAGKNEYLAWLAIDTGKDLGLIARLEYHATHDGWHVHLKPSDLNDLAYGVVKQSGERRILCNSTSEPVTGKPKATALAFRMFNIQHEAEVMP